MPLAREISYLRGLGLGDLDLARAVGSANDVRSWPPAESGSSDWVARIGELVGTAERLEYLIEPDSIALWLRTSIPSLGWATPLDLIGQGHHAQVTEVITAFAEGPTAT